MARTSRSKNKNNLEHQPEFPGAPVWEHWEAEKRELKKQEVGRIRRLGRGILEFSSFAVTVADQERRALTDHRLKRNQQKLKTLPDRIEWLDSKRENLESKPETRLRRLGSKALKLFSGASKLTEANASVNVDRLSARKERLSKQHRGPITAASYKHQEKIRDKRTHRYHERVKEFAADKQKAWKDFIDSHPEKAEAMRKEQISKSLQAESKGQGTVYLEMFRRSRDMVQYLNRQGQVSFSGHSMPRPDKMEKAGITYDELAKSTLEKASKYKQEDGTINLLGKDVMADEVRRTVPLTDESFYESLDYGVDKYDRAQMYENGATVKNGEFARNYSSALNENRDRLGYDGGVAVALWKIGVVDIKEDRMINYGGHRQNPEVHWQKQNDVIYADIPYNPENELHQMLAGDNPNIDGSMIEVAISRHQHQPMPGDPAPFINVRHIPAAQYVEHAQAA